MHQRTSETAVPGTGNGRNRRTAARFEQVITLLESVIGEPECNGQADAVADALEFVRMDHGCVFVRDTASLEERIDKAEKRRAVRATVRVNKATGRHTDLPRRGRYADLTADITVRDALDINELDQLSRLHGAVGTSARRVLLDTLIRYLRTRVAASTYTPRRVTPGDGHTYTVHNNVARPRARWRQSDIAALRRVLTAEGLFDLEVPQPEYGIACTSMSETNPDMGARQWTVDSMKAGLNQRETSPENWRRSLVTNAGFHITKPNMDAALNTIRDPRWYRDGPAKTGMAHIFLPRQFHHESEGLKWDEVNHVPRLDSILQDAAWGNRKRLESQALLVFWIAETIRVGLADPSCSWGFKWSELRPMQRQYLVKALQVTMSYLLAVQWNGIAYDHAAPTVSSWEEAPFAGGCASDSGFLVDAAQTMQALLFDPEARVPGLAELRLELCTVTDKRLAAALARSPFADFRIKQNYVDYVHAGKALIAKFVVSPILSCAHHLGPKRISLMNPHGVMQFRRRAADSSLALLAAHHRRFSRDGYVDALVRFGIIRFLEHHLIGDDRLGMIRYGMHEVEDERGGTRIVFDSYLNLGFHPALLLTDLFVPRFIETVRAEQKRIAGYELSPEALPHRDRVMLDGAERFADPTVSTRRYKDARSVATMVDRQHLSLPEYTARWSIGTSAAIIAMATAKIHLIEHISEEGWSVDSRALYEAVDGALTRMINISVATLVSDTDSRGGKVLRADGTPLPRPLNVMEAFQFVLSTDGHVRPLPGEHTLPWSASQIFAGLKLAEDAAARATHLPKISRH